MSLRQAIEAAASSLSTQRARMEIISSNLANVQTTKTLEGGPFMRRLPIVRAMPAGERKFRDALDRAVRGVQVVSVTTDKRPPLMKYEPGHPDADARGYVAYPNIDPVEEMVDMLSAIRSYEAGTNVIKSAQRMNENALSIIR